MELTEQSILALTNNIKVIALSMQKKHQPEECTKEDLMDRNSDKLFKIANEIVNRYCPKYANLQTST